MALKIAANKVLEIAREVVASKESEASFEEKMELLRRSVSRGRSPYTDTIN